MVESQDNNAVLPEKPVTHKFPKTVIIVLLTVAFERFSFSLTRAVLTLYLRSKLDYSDEIATEIYHMFTTLVTFFPIVGGILADNYFGKFKTIMYIMFIYAAGNIILTTAAVPNIEIPTRICSIIGLFIIALGTGGIRPCISAFGGDQFVLPQQEKHLTFYFSILYFNICIGGLVAKTVAPILRSDVYCFGDKDCYPLPFGVSAVIILISIIIFASSKNWYVMKKSEGDRVIRFVKCILLGVRNKIFRKNSEHQNWLDSTEPTYDRGFIQDVRKTISILTMFTTLPMFWALLDQLVEQLVNFNILSVMFVCCHIGSRWTLQATKMDGRFGYITIKPDQLPVFDTIFILILIPLSQQYVYPFLTTRSILTNPLHKLTLGGVLAALAFVFSGIVEIYIKTTYPVLPEPGFSQLRIYNGNPCSILIQNDQQNIMYTIPSLSHFTNKQMNVKNTTEVRLRFHGSCIEAQDEIFSLEDNMAISFFISGNNIERFTENVDKSKSGLPVVRFLLTDNIESNLSLFNEIHKEVEVYLSAGISSQMEVFMAEYSIRDGYTIIARDIKMDNGGVYNIIMDKVHNNYETNMVTITQPNSITMAWLLPQLLMIAIAEVLFAITGSEFIFKEAPETMKSVMTAAWLIIEATGNVIIIVITRIFIDFSQETQTFIYAGLMCISILIFHLLSKKYRFRMSDEVKTEENNDQ